MTWSVILEVGLDPARCVDRTLVALFGAEDFSWSTEEAAVFLGIVASRRGQNTVSRADYREEHARILEEDARKWRHGDALHFPTDNQVAQAFEGDWDEALKAAGLEVRAPMQVRPTGVEVIDALELCIEAHGALPAVNELELFMRVQQIPLARRRRPFTEEVAELRRRRSERGVWTPPGRLPKSERPDFGAPPPSELNGELAAVGQAGKRQRKRWSRDDCIEALIAFLDWLPTKRRATQRAYAEFQRLHPEHPWASAIIRKGGFRVLLPEARKERARRRSAS